MRRFPVLIVAAGAVAVASGSIIAVATKHFLGSTAVEPAPTAKSELTTGSIDARWPKPGVERQTAVAAAAPKLAALEAEAAPEPEKRVAVAKPTCNNPNALGVSRTVQIDTMGGPGFGMSQYRDYDFLQFFSIGKHATWHPEVLKQVVAAGHTVGSHTWSHQNLAHKSSQEAQDEIEKGMSAVAMMAGTPIAPFFRYPQLRQTANLKAYLVQRNVAAFSIDIDSEDFKIKKPDVLVGSTMAKLKKNGKGIILMHDLHKWTALAVPELLAQLKANGYKVVHVRAKDTLDTLPKYDAIVAAAQPAKSKNARAISAAIQTVD